MNPSELATSPADAAANDAAAFRYEVAAGAFDEAFTANGQLRAPYALFHERFAALGAEAIEHAWGEGRRLIAENGITFNVYGEGAADGRPWRLDPVPLLIGEPEWQRLEAGLLQRARVLEALLDDIYGPMALVRAGVLPADLIYGSRGFLRPCHKMQVPGGIRLHFHACDLIRFRDGSWHAIGDRTQVPTGLGYTLENRHVLSRVFSTIFRDCRVRRLAQFYEKCREALSHLAPPRRAEPRIVLLSGGPEDDGYFEHAFLARYLGYMLVEGADLTVRDNRVYVKTLNGLQPVDVIMRRIDDDLADPLEMRGGPLVGVAGLVQAAQSGTVAIANALGSSLVQAPAFLAFLPAVCKTLLGEDLLLPSLPTWWCGEPASLEYARVHFEQLMFKPAFRRGGEDPVVVHSLDDKARVAFRERMLANPRAWVAQEPAQPSFAPVWENGRLQPRPVALRTQAVASSSGEHHVMPGGLARVSAALDESIVSLRHGGGSKDAWILSTKPVEPIALFPSASDPVPLIRSVRDLPSRTADNLFWLGRYAERTECSLRLARALLNRLVDETATGDSTEIRALLTACGPILAPDLVAAAEKTPVPVGEQAALAPRVQQCLFDPHFATGIGASIVTLHRTAWRVRDRLSADMWRLLGSLRQNFLNAVETELEGIADALAIIERLILELSAFGGLVMESMTRVHTWRFLDIGRRVERGVQTARLLRVTLSGRGAMDVSVLRAVLEVADSAMTYRSRYLNAVQIVPVVDLLLADETNPRSVAFQAVALAEHVERLPRADDQAFRSDEQRLSLELLTRLRLTAVRDLDEHGSSLSLEGFNHFLLELEEQFGALSEAITRTYFAHIEPWRQGPGKRTGDAGAARRIEEKEED